MADADDDDHGRLPRRSRHARDERHPREGEHHRPRSPRSPARAARRPPQPVRCRATISADVDDPGRDARSTPWRPRPVAAAGAVAPEHAGDDGQGQEAEAHDHAAPADGVAALQAGDQVVEGARRARLQLALLDEVEQRPWRRPRRAPRSRRRPGWCGWAGRGSSGWDRRRSEAGVRFATRTRAKATGIDGQAQRLHAASARRSARKASTIVQARSDAPSCRPTAGKCPASVQRCERLAVWKAKPARVAVTVHEVQQPPARDRVQQHVQRADRVEGQRQEQIGLGAHGRDSRPP